MMDGQRVRLSKRRPSGQEHGEGNFTGEWQCADWCREPPDRSHQPTEYGNDRHGRPVVLFAEPAAGPEEERLDG
jgi:hypothetical protein